MSEEDGEGSGEDDESIGSETEATADTKSQSSSAEEEPEDKAPPSDTPVVDFLWGENKPIKQTDHDGIVDQLSSSLFLQFKN